MFHRRFLLVSVVAALPFTGRAGDLSLENDVKPALKKLCADCHNPEKLKGDFDMMPLLNSDKPGEHKAAWEKIAEVLENGDMPPDKKPQPTAEQRAGLVKFVDSQLHETDCRLASPGRVTIRRLNREEFKNTVRDLVRVDFDSNDFPNDEIGHGFDNIGDVLSLSPLLMEKFVAAAEQIARKALNNKPGEQFEKLRIRSEEFLDGAGQPASTPGQTLALMRPGEVKKSLWFPVAGQAKLRIKGRADVAGLEPTKLRLTLNGKEAQVLEFAQQDKNVERDFAFPVEKGTVQLGLELANNYYEPNHADPKLRGDRNIYLQNIEVEIPRDPRSDSLRMIVPEMPAPGAELSKAKVQLQRLMLRAYRRPPTTAEIERTAGLVEMTMKAGGSYLEGMGTALTAVLASPHFLFRWELDPEKAQPGSVRRLNDYEIASRLSYFLWRSMPDDALLELAGKGELSKPEVLKKEARRMLADWRGQQMLGSFAEQWLQLRTLDEIDPDPEAFRGFDYGLKSAFAEEARQFIAALVKDDRPIHELLDARFTFVNEALAKFYGIPGVSGGHFRRVELPAESPRGGVVTMGGVLLGTSTPTRTSPVIRGKWVLEQILGTPPPPAPPDVPAFPEQSSVNQSASLRQRFEQHRANPDCASCHAKMDPLGFALENFDGVGRWRTKDGKFPIETAGALVSGEKFADAAELKRVLRGHKAFPRSLSEKVLTFALGRGLSRADKCHLDAIVAATEAGGWKFSALFDAVITSEAFLSRKVESGIGAN